MRIKHTEYELYRIYYYLPCESDLFKNVKRWYYYKSFSSKYAALSAIKRYKEKNKGTIYSNLVYKIVWFPYTFCSDDKSIIVYNEDSVS